MSTPANQSLLPTTTSLVPSSSREACPIASGEVLAGRYTVERLLGEGAFAWVFSARDAAAAGDVVAIKMLRPERAADASEVRRFEHRELAVLQRVHAARAETVAIEHEGHSGSPLRDVSRSCQNVVRALRPEIGVHRGLPFMVLELIDGPSLRETLSREGALPSERVRSIGAGIARGLAAIHAAGGVHRDLKPENVRLRGGEEPVILDLGIVAARWETQGLTETGHLLMTPLYAAPEQFTGVAERPSDVYALGLLLHEMLTGKAPLAGRAFAEIRVARLARRMPDIHVGGRRVADDLAALVQRCLERDPRLRPTAGDVATALSAPPRSAARRLYRVALVSVLLVGVVAVVLFGRGRGREAPVGQVSGGARRSEEPVESASVTKLRLEPWKLPVTDGPELLSNVIRAVVVDKKGEVWFGTFGGGVSRYDPENNTWKTYTQKDGLAHDQVEAIAVGADGALWFGTIRGVSRYDPKRNAWKTYLEKDGLARNHVRAIAVGRDGALWFVTDGGVGRYDPKGNAWKNYVQKDDIRAIAVGADGALWLGFGIDKGVSRYDPTSNGWKTYTQKDGLANDGVPAIAVGPDGALWFGTYGGGVSRYDPKSNAWKTYTKDDGLAYNRIQTIAVGADGALWFGTARGVSRYDPTSNVWKTHTQEDGLAEDDVRAIAVGRDGALWFGTHEGVSRYDFVSNAWKTYTQRGGLAGNSILAIARGAGGALWFGTRRGLMQYDPTNNAWKTYTKKDGFVSDRIERIAVGADGALWFGTDDKRGVSRYDLKNNARKIYTREDGLAHNHVRAIAVGADGALWFGTDGGASRYDPTSNAWKTYTQADGLAHNRVSAIAAGPDGALWFVTGSGVSRYDPTSNAWKTYTRDDAIVLGAASAIAAGADGTLWLGSHQGGGLGRYDPTSYAWKGFSKYGFADDGVHAIATGPDGALWSLASGGERWLLATGGVARTSFDNATGESGALLSISPKRSKIAVTSSAVALTRPTGLSFVTPTLPNRFSALATFPPGATETALARGPGDSIWVATELNGLALRPSPFSQGDAGDSSGPRHDLHLTRAEGLPSMTVTALAPVPGTGHARLWIGTSAGPALVAFEHGALRVEATPKWDDMPTGPVDALAATDDGAVFIAYNSIPATRFLDPKLAARRAKTRVFRVPARGTPKEILSDQAPFSTSQIRALAVSADRRLWAGTTAGLFVAGGDPAKAGLPDAGSAKLTAVLAKGRLPLMSIRHVVIAPDEPNTVWMASDREGDTPPLVFGYRSDTQSVSRVDQELGVPRGDAIDDLTVTDDGYLVVAVDFELARGRVFVPP